jgi:hypothetical protein
MDLLQDHLKKSKVTSSYAKEFKIGELELECPMHTDCTMMDGEVGLTTDKNNTTFTLDIHFDGDDVTLLNPVPVEQLIDVRSKILAHPYLHMIQVSDDVTDLGVKCWMETECKEKDWCSSAFGLLDRSPASEELVCSVQFGDGLRRYLFSYSNELYFLPNDGLFWVKRMGVNLGNARPSVNANSPWKGLDVSGLTDLFITNEYPNLVDDIGSNTLEVGVKSDQCNFIELGYSQYVVDGIKSNDPGFIGNLSVLFTQKFGVGNISTADDRFQIYGYCVFISPDGEFILVEP